MGHYDASFGDGVSHQPTIRASGEIGLGGVVELRLTLHPGHDLRIGVDHILLVCRAEGANEIAACPFGKFVFLVEFIPHPVYALDHSIRSLLAYMSQNLVAKSNA